MNTYLFSIHPKWCEKIFNGEKTIEVRKTAPKKVPFKVYVYCTGVKNLNLTEYTKLHRKTGGAIDYWHGKVIGEFICNKVDKLWGADAETEKQTCLTMGEMFAYAKGKPLYGLHISALKIYDKPRELGEFYSIKQCKPAYSPFGYQWTWEDRHKRNTGGRENEYRPVPIECHRCKSLVGGKDYLDEKSGCILFDYECVSKYHKPLARPPQSYMRIQCTIFDKEGV